MPKLFKMFLSLLFVSMVAACVPPSPEDKRKVLITDTEFSNNVEFLGSQVFSGSIYSTLSLWRLRSWVDKRTHVAQHQLYVDELFDTDWRHYDDASDDNARHLKTVKIAREAKKCTTTRGICGREETVGITLDDEVLREHVATGYRIQVRAKSGDNSVLTVEPWQIAAQFAAIDGYFFKGTVVTPAPAVATPVNPSPNTAAPVATSPGTVQCRAGRAVIATDAKTCQQIGGSY